MIWFHNEASLGKAGRTSRTPMPVMMNTTLPSNTLGKASLILGILGCFFVFLIGLCAGVGKAQGWLAAVAPIFFVLAASSAFLGFLAVVLGFLGLFGRHQSRGVAIAGLLLGTFAMFLFIAILNAAQQH